MGSAGQMVDELARLQRMDEFRDRVFDRLMEARRQRGYQRKPSLPAPPALRQFFDNNLFLELANG